MPDSMGIGTKLSAVILSAIVLLVVALGAGHALAHERHAELATGRFVQAAMDHRPLATPARNSLYSCERQSMGEALDRPWADQNGFIDLSKKPNVEGVIQWQSQLNLETQELEKRIQGNGLPSHPTGRFPIERGTEAHGFDRNPNVIQSHGVSYSLPSVPRIAATPGCLPMGVIGVALSGGVFFSALDAPGRDAVANEIFDRCHGHPERNGRYHYHQFSPCFDQGEAKTHSPLIGFTLDGFGIYGPRDGGGHYITNVELDECHGHSGPVPSPDSSVKVVYHYHANQEFPYLLGCFRGGAVDRPEQRGPRPRRAAAATPASALSMLAATAFPAAPPQRPHADASPAAADISVVTLGTGGPPANSERAGPSALLRHGRTLLLVDMGRDTQTRLQEANTALRDLTALFFTHHHLDHNEEFLPILLKARLQGGAGQVIGPPGTKRYTDFALDFYREDSDYRAQRVGRSGESVRAVGVREVSGGESFSLAGLKITTARVNHTIHTVAYRFDAGGKSIVISGDLSYSPSLIELARGADVLVMDAGQLAAADRRAARPARREGETTSAAAIRAHSSLNEVAEMAHQANVKRLVLTHFVNANVNPSQVQPRLAEIFTGEIIFARDHLEIRP